MPRPAAGPYANAVMLRHSHARLGLDRAVYAIDISQIVGEADLTFDDVLRQADDLAAQAAQQRADRDRHQACEDDADAEFQRALREFGTWFAKQALARSLETETLYLEPEPPASVQPRSRLFRSTQAPPPSEPRPTRRGWVMRPLMPDGQRYSGGALITYDTVSSYGDQVSSKKASRYLTVDQDGEVVVGALGSDGLILYPPHNGFRYVGTHADHLTRDALAEVSGLSVGSGLQLLALYVANAKVVLQTGNPYA